jgi:hypothetical protein
MTDPASQVPPAGEAQCPSCGCAVAAGAAYCPSCGRAVAAAPPEVDIGGWVKAGWDLFARNLGPAIAIPLLIIVPAIAFVFVAYFGGIVVAMLADALKNGENGRGFIALGIYGVIVGLGVLLLALILPALTAGIYACFLEGMRTGKLTASKLGAGFGQWWAATWVGWLMGLAVLLCLPFFLVLVGFLAVYVVAGLYWLALFHVVDQRRGGMEALGFAWRATTQGRFWMMLLFTFLILTLINAGASAMWLGMLVSTPIGIGALAAGYEALRKREQGRPHHGA